MYVSSYISTISKETNPTTGTKVVWLIPYILTITSSFHLSSSATVL